MSEIIVYGEFRASYVQLENPTQFNGSGEAKYRIALLVPKTNKKLVKKLEDNIKKAAEAKFPGKKFESPLHDGDDREEVEYHDHFYLNATNRYPVGIVDGQKNKIDASNIYSGCYVNAILAFYPYKSSKIGVGVSVSSIQKTRDGEKFGGNRDTTGAFEVIEVDDDDIDIDG